MLNLHLQFRFFYSKEQPTKSQPVEPMYAIANQLWPFLSKQVCSWYHLQFQVVLQSKACFQSFHHRLYGSSKRYHLV